jgi:hypothetical protein
VLLLLMPDDTAIPGGTQDEFVECSRFLMRVNQSTFLEQGRFAASVVRGHLSLSMFGGVPCKLKTSDREGRPNSNPNLAMG